MCGFLCISRSQIDVGAVQGISACKGTLRISGTRSEFCGVLFLIACIKLVALAELVVGVLLLVCTFVGCLCARLYEELVRERIAIVSS